MAAGRGAEIELEEGGAAADGVFFAWESGVPRTYIEDALFLGVEGRKRKKTPSCFAHRSPCQKSAWPARVCVVYCVLPARFFFTEQSRILRWLSYTGRRWRWVGWPLGGELYGCWLADSAVVRPSLRIERPFSDLRGFTDVVPPAPQRH